jgi:protocatechuate 3,4-dioxygenase beta subunit
MDEFEKGWTLDMKTFGRRELMLRTTGAMTLLGLGNTFQAKMAEAATPVVLTPPAVEGPYFVEEKLNRSDIVVDLSDNSIAEGLPLMLGITVSQSVNGVVSPLPNAYVDIWQANAYGVYSDEGSENTLGKKFLRGYQVTDTHGNVHFLTVYPGWYSGRTAHIHCRVRLYSGSSATYSFETQFFFDETITDRVYSSVAPYTTRAQRDTTNASDQIYSSTDCTTGAVSGNELLLVLNANASRAVASYSMILDLTATAADGCIVGGTQGGGSPPTGGPPAGGPPAGGGSPGGAPPAA